MRIDSFQKVSSIYQANCTKQVSKTNGKSKTDQLEISQMGKDYQVAKAALVNAPDVRMDKINEIKARMEAGTYNVKSEEVANKLVESYFDQSI